CAGGGTRRVAARAGAPCVHRVPQGRDHDRGLRTVAVMTPEELVDRTAVADVVLRYFELVDSKDWDHMDEVFTEDTTARWTANALMEGRDNVVGALQHMIGTDEVVTHHHVASMRPVIDGDTAHVDAR